MADIAGRLPYLSQDLARHLGTTSAKKLAKLGLHTVEDLLWYVPFRLQDPGDLTPISGLTPGAQVVLNLEVVDVTTRTTGRPGMTLMKVMATDGSRLIELPYFIRSRRMESFYRSKFRPGVRAFFSGKVREYRGELSLTQPKADFYDEFSDVDALGQEATRIQPVYHASSAISSRAIGKAIQTVLGAADQRDIPDIVPDMVRAQRGMGHLVDALRHAHLVAENADYQRALTELKFTEAFVLQVLLQRRRFIAQRSTTRAWPPSEDGILARFDERLPFALTAGQQRIGAEISHALNGTAPMMRLLQGDVGSGKTIVALRAMLQVVEGGGQAALLAPTEVLAYQHYRTILDLLGELSGSGLLGGEDHVGVALVTGSQKAAERRTSRADVASGAAGIVVGTHALFSDDVQFANLGFVVVDEQHRFGVEQRDRLRQGPSGPIHVLHMTATPIPRTIALTVFGDLETSTLDELPAGRAAVETYRIPSDNERWVRRMWQRAAEEISAGGRAYVVCPRIDDDGAAGEDGAEIASDDDEAPRALAAVTKVAAQLAEDPALQGIGIGQLHGRMSAEDKDRAMADFAAGRTPLLVSTTVIEVGVDVPDATVMIILDADRFGLAQLHQLRGRIGRGSKPGVCFIVDQAREGQGIDRLSEFTTTTDGFALAEIDLATRREGDVLGRIQTGGRSGLRVLSAIKDRRIIEDARDAAAHTLAGDPDLSEHRALLWAVMNLADEGEYLERT
ncbi:ATP-dependent DNA helicase RecG [Bowdeniella massiliensis]|uniref:ATP-dependent DNA helicase RecG n=1 Tax=Bowdeniella massiliensis TaxID=2932264 RepID=UPI002027FB0C|nr:ATP-dependent DNA helicase RecG [Bowdeniella massiliensis]